jgi:hypothetical protein
VWFFLLWCYDIFNIFPVWLSCDLLSMMFKYPASKSNILNRQFKSAFSANSKFTNFFL